MTKADICNVELPSEDQLIETIGMLASAAGSVQDALDQRWTLTKGGES